MEEDYGRDRGVVREYTAAGNVTHHKHDKEQCLLHVLLSSTNWPRVLHPILSSTKLCTCYRHKAVATAHSSFSFSKTVFYI